VKKLNRFVIGVVFVLVVIIMVSINKDKKNSEYLSNEEDQVIIIENNDSDSKLKEGIDKALAIKMIALYLEDKQSIMVRDREIDYLDCQSIDWFDKYFNKAIVEGWFQTDGDRINPLGQLTYAETQIIANYFNIDLSNEKLAIHYDDEEAEIEYIEFIKLYNEMIASSIENNEFSIETMYIFATPAISNELDSWEVVTDKGIYNFEGLYMDEFIDKRIEVLVKDNDILHIGTVIEEEPILENAYLISINENEAEIFINGLSRVVSVNKNLNLGDGEITDVIIDNNTLISIQYKTSEIGGVVKRIASDTLILEGSSPLKISEDTKYYNKIDGLKGADISDVIVGYDTARIILDNDNDKEVAAIIIDNEVPVNNIRVVISTSNYESLYHEDVRLSSEMPYSIYINDLEEAIYEGEMDIASYNLESGDSVKVVPNEGGKISITSITRGTTSNPFHPAYRGVLEIEKVEEGFIIINEVDFEAYLYSVVPSEMPSSYGLEALKVQAICARSYAYTQLLANRYHEYGGHVDDSVSCQVYNNINETTDSITAVDETKGEMLLYNGQVIVANFFSTSCGVTADSGDVWPSSVTKEFPTTSSDYLRFKFQGEDEAFSYDLSKEEDFINFIEDDGIITYDSEFSWYRWQTTMTWEQIGAVINQVIETCYEKEPKLIKTLDENNIFRSRAIGDIGEFVDLWVYSRGSSGIITELVIEGSNGIYKIASEYYIRKIIAPINYTDNGEDVIVHLSNEGTQTNISYMPSAFYYMSKIYDSNGKLISVDFIGGGYGHGVGMSQNGVKSMVDLGYSYNEILLHYYEGVEISQYLD
jgi:stage II sporulation protein D